ncbi:nitrate reductase [Deltaproteobacteria bacterium]|nr:nitrate reductase [Deltaproteobacteria bacterium]
MHESSYEAEALQILGPDVQASPLYNPDLAPVPPSHRNWTTYNFAALWISMAHCIPTYTLAGGLMAGGMNWWQALLTIGVGNLIVLVPILLNAHPGTKYGISFPVLARASFGTEGAKVPAVLRALVACGWFGINTFIGGLAIQTFITTFWPGFATLGAGISFVGLPLPAAIGFMIFWAMNLFIIFKGMNAVRVFENWAAPIVLVLAVGLLLWVMGRAGGLGSMLNQPSKYATIGEFWPVFVPSVTGMVAFWSTLALNIPDFTRFGKGQREQMVGQALGLPTTMIAFSALAVMITSASMVVLPGTPASDLWNPEFLLGKMTSAEAPAGLAAPLIASAATRAIVAVISVAGIVLATLSVNIAANVVGPANDFANLAPKLISFKTGGLITGILGILCLPWKLMEDQATYLGGWLGGIGILLGPVAAIMIADYWVIRRQTLDVRALFREGGAEPRFNPVAMAALAAGILPNLPGFLHATKIVGEIPAFLAAIYPYGWFTGVTIAFAVYVAGSQGRRVGAMG